MKTIEVYLIWAVTWPKDEMRSTEPVYFKTEAEAKKASKAKIGWYGTEGSPHERECRTIPKIRFYSTALEWAKDNLTFNEMSRNGFTL